ncbi:unnamed protein product [Lathyrus sativus]|nr:unnamed protein product [Lathyrus sativus]
MDPNSNPNSKSSTRFHNPFGSRIVKTVFFRTLLLATAISIVSLLHSLPTMDLVPKTYDHDCTIELEDSNITVSPGSYLFQSRIINNFWGSFDSLNCKKEINLVSSVVKELKSQHRLMNHSVETLCIGEASNIAVSTLQKLGFSNVINHSFFSFNKKNFVYSLDRYRDSSFDFVLSDDFGKVTVPALLVLEVERILKPNGIGVLLLDFDTESESVFSIHNINNINMIRTASPVSSLLRFSSIFHVGVVNNHGLIVFKKNSESEPEPEPQSENRRSLFYHEDLPEDCRSVNSTKKFMNLMEPLMKERSYEKKITYLPKFVNVSTYKKNLVYVNIGESEVNYWFPESYPIDKKDFNVYFVHYNASVILSHVKEPRVTFVYHPKLNENYNLSLEGEANDVDEYMEEEEFDLVVWFKETVKNADFVVLKMNAGRVEMKFLYDIYKNGVMCFVDEMFLSCEESEDGEKCMDVYNGLRTNGVFVHQWWNSE